MALSNETQQFILSVVDANQEYNTKLIVLFVIWAYTLFMFAFSFWVERVDARWDARSDEFLMSRVILNRAYRWISGAYIFIFPLMFLIMYRTVPLERLLQLIFGMYIPFFGAFLIFGIMYSYDVIMEFSGVRQDKFRQRKAFFKK